MFRISEIVEKLLGLIGRNSYEIEQLKRRVEKLEKLLDSQGE